MWSQQPLTKRNSGEEYQGPLRATNETYSARQIMMELRNRSEPVSLRATKRIQNKEKLT